MTKQKFIEQYQIAMQAHNRKGWIFLITILSTAIVFGFSVPLFLMPLEEKGFFDNWVVSINEYSVRGIFGCFVLMYAFASYHVRPSYGVSCQTCGETLCGTSARVALITGICGFCSEKALDADNSYSADLIKKLRLHD